MFGINENKQPQPEGKVCLLTTKFKRLKGHLYYVGSDEYGNLTLQQTLMVHGKKKSIENKEVQ